MNIVKNLERRSTGFGSIVNYDTVLSRLECCPNDVYKIGNLDEIRGCRFCTVPGYEQLLALSKLDGHIVLQQTDICEKRRKRVDCESISQWQITEHVFGDLVWMPGEFKLVVSSFEYGALLCDASPTDVRIIENYTCGPHDILSLAFHPQDKAIFLGGCQGGAILVFDIRTSPTQGPKDLLQITKTRGQKMNITDIVFQDDFSFLSCSKDDCTIKVWDMRKYHTVHPKKPMPRHTLSYVGQPFGFSSLLVSPDQMSLYASCLAGTIYQFNIGIYKPYPVAAFYGHGSHTDLTKSCLSPDGEYLASGSQKEHAFIWSTHRPGVPLMKLNDRPDNVYELAWRNSVEPMIVTNSVHGHAYMIWRVGPEHREGVDLWREGI